MLQSASVENTPPRLKRCKTRKLLLGGRQLGWGGVPIVEQLLKGLFNLAVPLEIKEVIKLVR